MDKESLALEEYKALKAEQLARITFRDNLIFVTVGAVGAVASVGLGFGEGHRANPAVFLVLPWLTLILGWTYLRNDDKVTSIRKYVQTTLSANVGSNHQPFGWEEEHIREPRRAFNKIAQTVVDLVLFIVSGGAGLLAYCIVAPALNWRHYVVVGGEGLLLLALAFKIFEHSLRAGWTYKKEGAPGSS